MSVYYEASGLTADWLNGWLAAIGATVLIPELRLAWTNESVPVAILSNDEDIDMVSSLSDALPTVAQLSQSVIAKELTGAQFEFGRNVTLQSFQERAVLERSRGGWHLAASVSDLRFDLNETSLDHAAFDPPAPRGETLWSRAVACAKAIATENLPTLVSDTLAGRGTRKKLNGLGFDAKRLPLGVHGPGPVSELFVDPVIELLCFSALALFPTRGNGRAIRQRGWRDSAMRRGAFEWIAWIPSLNKWGIDALLDLKPQPRIQSQLFVARYRVVPYQPLGSSDVRRAYFAERVE